MLLSKRNFGVLVLVFIANYLFAQLPTNGLDVKHYTFYIFLNDSNNIIRGKAEITTRFTKNEKKVIFDLVAKNAAGKGMSVISVGRDNNPIQFYQDSQHLVINEKMQAGSEATYDILYEGIPADGLIIGNNKYGNRVFFGDNWPNRAHNWLPCNDHLSDKATVDFVVTAPDHYQVVSNGKKIEEANIGNHLKLTHWKEETPLPTKVMVIGVAIFAVNNMGNVNGIPVSAWVYPEDRDSGFAHYAIAKNILHWYQDHIGPYAFEKLANVQSKTIFGGMENASCIFYFENSVNTRDIESLMAHEIAHQWFGDNVTEKDWPHLWLSEGFATYMTDLYLESRYGRDSLKNLLTVQRSRVIGFSRHHELPVVDTTEAGHLMDLLNDNSYQKGAWVLHMLRRKLGDTLFWKGIRTYYTNYYASNATTKDLEEVFEKVSHQNLEIFFKQWLFTPGQPSLKVTWTYNKNRKTVSVQIEQTQDHLFEFPLQISFSDGSKSVTKTIEVKNKMTQKDFPISFSPNQIIIDPNVNLLFDL